MSRTTAKMAVLQTREGSGAVLRCACSQVRLGLGCPRPGADWRRRSLFGVCDLPKGLSCNKALARVYFPATRCCAEIPGAWCVAILPIRELKRR